MNKMKWLKRAILTTAAIGGINMNANAGLFGLGGTSWKEEVLLHDGTKIVVERAMDRGGRHEIGQKPPIKEQSLSFTLPSSNERIVWTAVYSKEVGYADLRPLLLDIIRGMPYLVTDPVGCLAYNKWQRPNPPYIFWRYEDKAWRQIELANVPVELKVPNLIISSPDTNVELVGKTFMTAADIAKLNGELPQPHYRVIVREAIRPSCETLIPYGNGGWLSLDWFSGKSSLQECRQVCESRKVSQQNCPCDSLFKGK